MADTSFNEPQTMYFNIFDVFAWDICIIKPFHSAGLILYSPETIENQRSLSHKNQSTDLQSKSMDWFLYDRDLQDFWCFQGE